MSKVPVYNLKGEKKKETTLDPEIFSVEAKLAVLHRVVAAYLANRRPLVAATKDRSQVRGGGTKPWKQKGTGRARAGSIRSPIWKGGGVTFGPTTARNYSQKVNKKERRKALLMALSSKVTDKKIVVVEDFKLNDIKTKDITNILEALPVIKSQNVLIVLAQPDKVVAKSVANLPQVKALLASGLNTYEVLRREYILLSLPALKMITETFAK